MKKTRKILSAVLAALMLASLSGCSEETETAEIAIPSSDSEGASFNTVTAEVGTISETYTLDANMSNPYLISISSSVSGKILTSPIEDGAQVSEGDVLLTIASDDIDKQITEQQIRLDSANQTYQTLCSTEGASTYEIESAALEIQIEQNQLDLLNAQKEDYTVRATTSGTVSLTLDETALAVGREVAQGSEICTISPDSGYVLCASTTTDALADVNFGTSVTVKHFTDEVAKGSVSDIIYTDKGADFSTYTYVISVPNLDSISYYGTFTVIFEAYTKDNVVLVPNEAVSTISNESYVDVLIDGVKVQTAVETGIVGDSKTEIISGLTGDEEIILS